MNLGTPDSLHALVQKRHEPAFILCEDVVAAVKPAISRPRRPTHAVPRALELLMHQAHNTLVSVYILSLRALTEDAATLTRRLLEIAVTAGYITHGVSPTDRAERAGCYLSRLWEDMPDDLRKTVPARERSRWQAFVGRHRKRFPHNGPCRRPRFIDMFKAIGQDQTYKADYSLLSSITHASPSSLIQVHASQPIPMRDDTQVSTMIVFSCRYYLAVADLWNRSLHLMPARALKPVIQRSVTFFYDRAESDRTT
jgi:hypothetical protein